MQRWVGLGLAGPPFAGLAWWAARRKGNPLGIAALTAMGGANMILIDQCVPIDARMTPIIAAGAAAAMVVGGWQLGKLESRQ